MNKWGIPDWLEKEVIERDKKCVYCGILLIEKMPPRGPGKQWQHGNTSSTMPASSLVKILPDVA
jgi:hypothetical protein